MEYKDIKQRLRNYKIIKAKKKHYELTLEELNEISITAVNYDTIGGKSYTVSAPTEDKALELVDNICEITKIIKDFGREVMRIENAISILNDLERDVIEMVYFNGRKYDTITYKLNKSFRSVKKIENTALKKIAEILN